MTILSALNKPGLSDFKGFFRGLSDATISTFLTPSAGNSEVSYLGPYETVPDGKSMREIQS